MTAAAILLAIRATVTNGRYNFSLRGRNVKITGNPG